MATLLASQVALASLIKNFETATLALEKRTLTVGILTGRIELLHSYWTKLQANHLELVTKERISEDSYFVDRVIEATEVIFMEVLGYLYDQRDQISAGSPNKAASTHPTLHNLPRIDLPRFSGERGD